MAKCLTRTAGLKLWTSPSSLAELSLRIWFHEFWNPLCDSSMLPGSVSANAMMNRSARVNSKTETSQTVTTSTAVTLSCTYEEVIPTPTWVYTDSIYRIDLPQIHGPPLVDCIVCTRCVTITQSIHRNACWVARVASLVGSALIGWFPGC